MCSVLRNPRHNPQRGSWKPPLPPPPFHAVAQRIGGTLLLTVARSVAHRGAPRPPMPPMQHNQCQMQLEWGVGDVVPWRGVLWAGCLRMGVGDAVPWLLQVGCWHMDVGDMVPWVVNVLGGMHHIHCTKYLPKEGDA